MNKCKLCGSNKLAKLQTIDVKRVSSFYKFDVSKFFLSDSFDIYQCLECDIKSFDRALPGDSDFYDILQELDYYYEELKKEFLFAIKKIGELNPKNILEVGAGRGYFLKKIKNNFSVKASELSEKSIQHLKKEGIELDTPKDIYDFICSFQVFEHVDDIKGILDFCDKKLVSGGYILISVPNNASEYFQEIFCCLDYPPHHMHQYSKKSLESIGRVMNYEVIDYWTESIRIEHFAAIIREKREIITKNSKYRGIIKKMAHLLDIVLLPYFFYENKFIGHTHTMVYKKTT